MFATVVVGTIPAELSAEGSKHATRSLAGKFVRRQHGSVYRRRRHLAGYAVNVARRPMRDLFTQYIIAAERNNGSIDTVYVSDRPRKRDCAFGEVHDHANFVDGLRRALMCTDGHRHHSIASQNDDARLGRTRNLRCYEKHPYGGDDLADLDHRPLHWSLLSFGNSIFRSFLFGTAFCFAMPSIAEINPMFRRQELTLMGAVIAPCRRVVHWPSLTALRHVRSGPAAESSSANDRL
jgi:hypothetical protein